MKIMKTLVVAVSLLLLVFSGCGDGLGKEIETGNPGDFVVDLRRLTLNASELGTLPGLNPVLNLTKFPVFATPSRAEVRWSSSDTDVATINPDTGAISVRTGSVDEPRTTIIRVEAKHDPSIYALCSLTVFPNYPARRRWNFAAHPTGGGNNALIPGDKDMGDGGSTLQATGGGDGYNNGYSGPGTYDIDPEDPYKYGVIPTGGPRSGLNWEGGTITQSAFYRAPANYFGPNTPAEPAASTGHLRTGGSSRFFRIAALQGPFEIVVNYMSNGTAGAHADIRIGDKEGIRVEGEGSDGTSDGKCIRYAYEENDFVPFVYLESDTGLRVYDVYVLSDAANTYRPVPDTFDITGNNTIDAGATVAYAVSINATTPTYSWEITNGAGVAEIVGPSSNSTVNLRALTVGQATLKVTVSTTNPDQPADTKTVSQTKTINAVYAPITAAAIGGLDSVEADKTITLPVALTPSYVLNPTYLWEITSGDGTYGEITGGTTNPTAVLSGIAQGSVTVKVTVSTTDPTTSTVTTQFGTKTISVTEASAETTWRFNATTAAAAGLSVATSGFYDIPSDTDFGDGLTLKRGTHATNAHAIRQAVNSSGISPQIPGCLQTSGSSDWGTLSGISGPFTIEIIYANTGGSNADGYPTISIGGAASNFTGGASIENTSNATTGTVTLTGNGSPMTLGASRAIRVFEIKLIPQ